jgi:hypothetical protein
MAMPSVGGLGGGSTCSFGYQCHVHSDIPWLTVRIADTNSNQADDDQGKEPNEGMTCLQISIVSAQHELT